MVPWHLTIFWLLLIHCTQSASLFRADHKQRVEKETLAGSAANQFLITLRNPVHKSAIKDIKELVSPYSFHLVIPPVSLIILANSTTSENLAKVRGVKDVTRFEGKSKIAPRVKRYLELVEDEFPPVSVIVLTALRHQSRHLHKLAVMISRFTDHSEVINSDRLLVMLTSKSALISLSILPEVHWIDFVDRHLQHNYYSGRVVRSSSLSSQDPQNSSLQTLQGAGQIIALSDSGVDMNSCFFADSEHSIPLNKIDPLHRKVITYIQLGLNSTYPRIGSTRHGPSVHIIISFYRLRPLYQHDKIYRSLFIDKFFLILTFYLFIYLLLFFLSFLFFLFFLFIYLFIFVHYYNYYLLIN
jgi:hypothetical protein